MHCGSTYPAHMAVRMGTAPRKRNRTDRSGFMTSAAMLLASLACVSCRSSSESSAPAPAVVRTQAPPSASVPQASAAPPAVQAVAQGGLPQPPEEQLPAPAAPPPARPDPLPKPPAWLARPPRCRLAPRPVTEQPCADRRSFVDELARVLRDVELRAQSEDAERHQALEARRQELLALDRAPKRGNDPSRQWDQELDAARLADERSLERMVLERDQKLAALEACGGAPVGFVRQLRAELRPQCREALLASWAATPPDGLDGDGYAAVRGLVIAARLDRLSFEMPTLRGWFDQPGIDSFIARTVEPWQRLQMARLRTWDPAIEALTPDSYGKLIALGARTEAARRLVASHRAARFPAFLNKDYVKRTQYFQTIDAAVGPAVSDFDEHRGAVLRLLERRGVIWHEALRSVLSLRRTGHREPVHSKLALPYLPVPADDAPAAVWLSRRLPSDAVERILSPEQLAEAPALSALVARGLPGTVRAYFDQKAPDPEQAFLLGEARVRLGLLYQSRAQLERARVLFDKAAPHPETELLTALAAVLERFDASASPPPADVLRPLVRLAEKAKGLEETDTPQKLGYALAALDLARLELASAKGDPALVQRASEHLTSASKALSGSEYAPCVESDQLKFVAFRPLEHAKGAPNCQPSEDWLSWRGR
jgi:hypothetical protein